MTQHTQPVGAGQQQLQQHQQQTSTPQQQQQHQTTTTPNTNNNNTSNNNNSSTTPTTTNNNQTQTVAVQQQQPQHQQNNNNNYQSQQQQQNATGGQIFNPQIPSANVYVPTLGMPAAAAAHHHHPQQHHHHQPGAMYQTMIPAAIPSNVYVNNVTANVNLHGWPHTVPHGAWVHPGGTPHYIHGDSPSEQGAPVIQPMGGMPVTIQAPNALGGPVMNPNHNAISGGTRGSRRVRGRGGTSGSRRGDYNMQRHPQPEGSPAPQQGGQNNPQDMQGQQTTDGQQMMTALPPSYVPHPQYATHAPQYPYAYPTFFAPQQHMIHPGQSAAAQQATGTPLYFSTMPVYNGPQMYNYGYYLPPVMNQSEYQYGEEVGVAGPLGEERQPVGEGGAMMWHQQPIYTDEYGMSPADMHAVSSDDINHNASSMGSANETPNLLSPNYTPMYEQMTQQMGVMHIYDDPQMGQIQVMHPQAGVPQLEEELSECGSQPSTAPIQMVPAVTAAVPPPPMTIEPHFIPVTGGAIMPIDDTLTPIATTPQHQQQIQQPALHQQQQQQQSSITGDNIIVDSNVQTYENVSNIQAGESVTSLNEEIVQQPAADNIAIDYQQLPQQQTQNVLVEAIQTDNFNNTNKTLMTDVQELPAEKTEHIVVANKSTDVAVETVVATNVVAPQQQQQIIPQPVYQQQQQTVQEKQHKQQYVAKQNVPQQQQQQYQHQQLQTQPVTAQQQQQPTAQPQQQQQTYYQASTQQHQQQHQHNHNQQQQHHQQQQTYENRKSSQMYNQQHQSRSRKYDYHHGHGSTSSNSDASSHHHQQQQTQQQQTTKTMSWTNSSQHKKSTNTVAVTATPTASHSSGSYNKQSNASNTSSSHTHSTRTYTNQQHHNYQQQQQQQQQNYHYQQQQPQTRNYGAMKMPSSPISSAPSTMERKTSQSSDAGKGQGPQSTSTASTTAAPHQFQQSQQTSTSNDAVPTVQQTTAAATTASAGSAAVTSISNKQHTQHYPPGFATKKHSFSNQGHSGPSTTPNPTTAAVTSSSSSSGNAVEASSTPAINLAPPVSATTPAAPSTQSWASLFASSSNASNSASSNTAASSTINTTSTSSSSNINYSKKPIAKVAPYEGITPVTPPPPVVTPGTLSYSAASAQNLPTPSSASTASTTAKKLEQQQSQRNSLANLDEFSLKFAQFLTSYKSDWATVSLRPRGLTNRSNYCYINSILQALLGCSPLYNLIRSIPKQAANLCEVKTPTVNAMMTFMSNFSNLPSGLRLRNAKGGKGNKDDLGGDLQCDPAFEPTEIYKLWNDSREEHVEGRQEDAEEFLSYILNKLNDEMLEVIKLIAKPNTEQNGQTEPVEEDGDVWQMICNNRNKGSVTRQTDFGCTPLSDIFRGELRSRLQREGEHSTDVIQPFFTLQLNIEKAASVKEALEILVGRDQLEGVTGSKSKQEVVAWQQMNLEKLPPILILHLKWFDYRSDGCTKILKKVEFPVELKIDSKILASKKYSQKQRAYRLFAVVYHDGKEATKGHYITDVYHTGYGSWLRFDDSSVKPVSENHVLLPRTPRVPYLLCYRRCDTIPQQSNNNQNSSSIGNNNNSSGNSTQSSSGK